jgi:capsular polysaccharide biosynthesis protein
VTIRGRVRAVGYKTIILCQINLERNHKIQSVNATTMNVFEYYSYLICTNHNGENLEHSISPAYAPVAKFIRNHGG